MKSKTLFLILGLFTLLSCKNTDPGQNNPEAATPPVYGDVDIHDPKTQIPGDIEPLIDVWMRDPVITIGKDGEYVLTGTTKSPENPDENAFRWNDGVYAWRSYDLENWEAMGLLWKLDDGPEWIRYFQVFYPEGATFLTPAEFYRNIPPSGVMVKRSLWSPRITYSKKHDTYLVSCCMSQNCFSLPPEKWLTNIHGGTFILKSTSGRLEGPYEITTDYPLTYSIDARIFEEEDGTLYFYWLNGNIGRLNNDLTALEEVHKTWQAEYGHEQGAGEGVHIFKHNGLYHLVLSIQAKVYADRTTYLKDHDRKPDLTTYDAVVATSKDLYGPYQKRYTSITNGGHGNHFMDKQGNWWGCVFYDNDPENNKYIPAVRPYLIPMQWEGDKIFPKHN